MKRILLLTVFLALNFLSANVFADKTDYLQGFKDGEPRCYIDVLERCYQNKEKNSVSKKRLRKLRNKINRLK